MSARTQRAAALLRRLLRRPTAVLSIAYLAMIGAAALSVSWLGLDPLDQDLSHMLEGPTAAYPFGADELGRDILARVIYGARTSLTTAFGAVALAASIGVPMGLVAGFFGGWRETVLMRLVDLMLALPSILLALALIAILGRSQTAALVAVGLTGVPTFARIVRAQVLSLKRREFVTAVEAFGGSASYSMLHSILPNAWSPILTQMVVLSSVAILLEAALAFLGVGIPPPTPSWGEMLRSGKEYLYDAPTYAVLPGLALTLTILSFDTLGRTLATLLEGREPGLPQTRNAAP